MNENNSENRVMYSTTHAESKDAGGIDSLFFTNHVPNIKPMATINTAMEQYTTKLKLNILFNLSFLPLPCRTFVRLNVFE